MLPPIALHLSPSMPSKYDMGNEALLEPRVEPIVDTSKLTSTRVSPNSAGPSGKISGPPKFGGGMKHKFGFELSFERAIDQKTAFHAYLRPL